MRKPVIALGVALAFLLSAGTVSLPAEGPYGIIDNGELLPRIARGLAKQPPGGAEPLTGPTTGLQAGAARTGATYCDGTWQGTASYYLSSWYIGDEFYAVYQDPETFGSCAGFGNVYTFDVTAIEWFVYALQSGITYDMQPLVYANDGDWICAVPGEVLCAGPLYAIEFLTQGAYIIELPFPDECCVYEEYFAGVYSGPFIGTGILGVVIDNGMEVTPQSCRTYNDYDGSWSDLVEDEGWNHNFELWSVGTAFDQNACPGKPADFCENLVISGLAAVSWTDPDANGATDRWNKFIPDFLATTACTLKSSNITLYGPETAGSPTMRVRVYGSNGVGYPGQSGNPPGTDPNLLGEIDVPYEDLHFSPEVTTVDFSVLPGWPDEYTFGTYDRFFISVSLSPNTPSPGTDVLSLLSDDGGGSSSWYTGTSGAYFGNIAQYLTTEEAFGVDYRWLITANVCCAFTNWPGIGCHDPGPDDWNTWGHDYQRTCRSKISVEAGCVVNPVWMQPLIGLNSFCEPTITDGRVYVSTDQKLCVFDLATGAPGNCVQGLPYIFSSNRGNVTIDGGGVYVTGGNAESLTKWDATLSQQEWTGQWQPALGDQNRFGVSVVYDISGTEVVVVGTENAHGNGGRLWCFETATGAAYAGWATNPLILPEGIWHSPSFDGENLYVGTNSKLYTDGRIYSIDATTGTINWTYTPPNPDEGFAGGLSLDLDYLYAASGNYYTGTGTRIKLDKTTGEPQWEYPEASALYGSPAINKDYLFINQDGGGGGVLVVSKYTGHAVYNFAVDGVGQVPQHVTAACDEFLFAGDRSGKWWLMEWYGFTVEHCVQFNGMVNGTALASDASGNDYAVVSIRSGNPVNGGGYLAAFRLMGEQQAEVALNTPSVDIHVLPGTGAGNVYTVNDALQNKGCADLHITSSNIYDPAPDDASIVFRNTQSRYAAALANMTVGNDYTAYFDESSKPAMLAKRYTESVDVELTRGDVALERAAKAMVDSKRAGRQLAAASGIVRTSNVTYDPVIASFEYSDVNWMYDGTDLARGTDVEEIEFITDDPDRLLFGNQPRMTIRYIGGCLPDFTSIAWNLVGAANEEKFTNTGRLGDDDEFTNLIWGTDPNGPGNGQLYDGSFLVAGPVPPNGDQVQFYIGNMYGEYPDLLLPDNRPSDNQCAFDAATDVHMGWKRTGGCPGIPEEIKGAWVRSYFIDSNAALAGTPYAAIGLTITQTEVGAYDPLFGDFALIRWDLTERYGETEAPVYAGTWTDWDAEPNYKTNHGIVSDVFNGYALWDWVTPTIAYGFLDPRMPTDYCGVNPVPYSPHRIQELGEEPGYTLWQGGDDESELWESVVNGIPRESGPHMYATPWNEDHFGLLVNKGLSIGPYETKSIVQAKFAVPVDDVGSRYTTDVATVEARCAELARRAAIWSGYARGDVNMDGCVNLIDVCWTLAVLTGGTSQIYPDFYNGDVDVSGNLDMNDAQYLLNYVTGLGPAPQGEWRFEF